MKSSDSGSKEITPGIRFDGSLHKERILKSQANYLITVLEKQVYNIGAEPTQ